ncbi:MAG TPA: hypothetical protein PKE64_22230 [Anaerolineae bacterium]|nr:hypothetical protein [Anaerolineae bacterium]HMR66738.1 hypothetical protein [Anaerolineae bacterium]
MKTGENTRSLNPKHVRTLIFTLGSCLLLVGLGFFHRGARASGDETDFKAIDGYITAKMQSARIPGLALAIVKDDQIIYLKGYGQAEWDGPGASLVVRDPRPGYAALPPRRTPGWLHHLRR